MTQRAVLHAHPDRWTVGLDQHLPPEERGRLHASLVGFAAELLGDAACVVEEADGVVEDTTEQRAALAAWRARDANDLSGSLAAALDGVLCGAFWESPVFRTEGVRLGFHRGWRALVEGPGPAELEALARRWSLLARDC